ncbi:MarR family transcriptional regulator [Streptococcus orisratti]|uniref:MarR family transcriptional regulator n=1 Tax=Streptococcus TaxID=1301 RepID=UPI0003611DD5|nr:MarR family transcriptional regulator [Streptococcus orisratti]MDY5636573.1 MarR family transcriptional regulator [Streptococcus orisratti]
MTYDDVIVTFNQFFKKYQELEYRQHKIDDLNFAEVETLVLIARNPQLTLAEIARKRQTSRSAVTQLVKRMETKNYLSRVEKDSKQYTFNLTKIGQKVYQSHQYQHEYLVEQLNGVLANYPDTFYRQLFSLMAEVEKVWEELPWDTRNVSKHVK